MPYQVVDATPKGARTEGLTAALKKANIKDMNKEGVYAGSTEPKETASVDTNRPSPEEQKQHDLWVNILKQVISPNKLSSRSTDKQDELSMVRKLRFSSLDDLKLLLPDEIRDIDPSTLEAGKISEEIKSEINHLYQIISP